MCGLYGWIQNSDTATVQAPLAHVTKVLACLNEIRGDDSTGMAWKPKDATVPKVEKNITRAQLFLRDNQRLIDEEICQPNTSWLIGHTRSRTVGEATIPNAHPFHFGSVLGAHNGHFSNHLSFRTPKKRYDVPECDSAHFFAYADYIGLKKAIGKSWGSIALTLSQSPYQKIKLYQDAGSKIAVAYIRSWSAVVWSSQEEHLAAALASVDIYLETVVQGATPTNAYLLTVPTEEIIDIRVNNLDGSEMLQWNTTPAPADVRPFVANTNYGYGTNCGTPYNQPMAHEWEVERDGHKFKCFNRMPFGGHRSDWSQHVFHEGALVGCKACNDTAPVQIGYTADTPVIQHKSALLVFTPDSSTTPIKTIIPAPLVFTKCPLCSGWLKEHSSAQAYECRKCYAWIERTDIPEADAVEDADERFGSLYGGE